MNNESPFSPVEDIVSDIKAGKMVIITDDADRENEGDLIVAAQCITPEIVNFMTKYGRGLICSPITESVAMRLELPMMVPNNRESFKTNFTVSVDAAKGITTGISASDRAETIRLLADDATIGEDLVQPGHIFPLLAKPGGVLRRAGHTEAATDLARLAGLNEVAVICEILNDDGSMARLSELTSIAEKHDLKIGTIESLIQYRRKRERLVDHLESINLPTRWGNFNLHMYQSTYGEETHLALVRGEIDPDKAVIVRVHSECLTGDVFGSQRCDCGGQLDSAMERISNEENGILLYMRQEGRGIGLKAKIHAYKLQEEGYDTVEANEKLGFPSDLRDYGIGAQILYDLGVRKIRLMTNNPKKVIGLNAHKLEIIEQIPIKQCPTPHNKKYLDTKREKLGHDL
ncbi:MAG: bifunctional 3,4-dihydroxy-2-butanone-4-phosphate synthase/GTP cyclohydrolase II [Verrucomicrobiales bacterium]|jgi:3,4-dihydroxy 2-butanone 4-phosphate synthase / GTP cyclohydrolase II|nr:bifunctional 3,4-dihydroxy-2-butanone-4-phosphate synthase/GTP cyclohydrolase II [Verrucomicrobiales bacterium]